MVSCGTLWVALACGAGVVVGVLATATIAAVEIASRVDDETGVANSVTDGRCCHTHHFADGRHPCRRKLDVGQAHLRDEGIRPGERTDSNKVLPTLSAACRQS